MKKLRYLLFAILLPAFIAVGCDQIPGDDKDDTSIIDDDDDKDDEDDKDDDNDLPEGKKLITKIVETGSFNSDYYDTHSYEPYSYEFKYDSQNRLKEYYAKEHDGNIYFKLTYSYDIQGEVRITNDYETVSFPLNSAGYITGFDTGYSKYSLTYDSEGYLTKVTPESWYQRYSYEYEWNNGNPVRIKQIYEDNEEGNNDVSYITSVFSSELNNKTTIDLNIFFFGLGRTDYLFEQYSPSGNEEHLCALIGLTGKRAKNYILSKDYESDQGAENKITIYTEQTEPALGSIIDTNYYRDFHGDGQYTFDSDGYPKTFVHQVKVSKEQYVYNGARHYVQTNGNEWYEQELEQKWGPGPWFYITLDALAPVVTYDTYTYTISYDK